MKKPFNAVASFTHLMGFGSTKTHAARAEDDDKKQRDDESDDDYAKRIEEEDKKEEAARAAAEEESDDDDSDDSKDAGAKKAAKAERERGARIMAHGFKCGMPEQAAVFAFDTGMSSASAISALNAGAASRPAAPAAAAPTLRDRMATAVPRANPGSGSAEGSGPGLSVADQIVAAGRLARGEK